MNVHDLQQIFKQLMKTAIYAKHQRTEGPLPLGSSKFGGVPHLPEGFLWYRFDGINFSDEKKERPLSFLAQINLADVTSYDEEKLLPDKGILYFFYDLETMAWGFDPKDKGCARVFYYDGPISQLRETLPPADLDDDYELPELALQFSAKMNLPDFDGFTDYCNQEVDWDVYEEEQVKFGYDRSEIEEEIKLLGYADTVQGSMLAKCELVSNGIYLGERYPKMSPEEQEQLKERSQDWTLLFQMGTIDEGDFELMFGDCGYIYFYIRKQDLQARNFDRIWLVLQCG